MLVDEQDQFLQDIALLIQFCRVRLGWKVTGGELYRTIEQEQRYIDEGKSQLKDPTHNYHTKRLAIDLNFFKNSMQLITKKELQPAGDYWEALHSQNRWGGNWQTFLDLAHFERHV